MHLTYLTHFDTFWHPFCCFWYFLLLIVPSDQLCGRAEPQAHVSVESWPIMMSMQLDWVDWFALYIVFLSNSIYFVYAGAVFLGHHLHINSNLEVLAHGCPKVCSFCQAASSFCNQLTRSLLVHSEMMDFVSSLLIFKDIPYAVLVRCCHIYTTQKLQSCFDLPRSHIVSDRQKGPFEPHRWWPEISCGRYSYQQLVCPREAAFFAADVVDDCWWILMVCFWDLGCLPFHRQTILYTLARNQSQNTLFGALAACGAPHH